ncbi:hypothetical protein ACQ4PT_046644 [Festuca glaucescens]
MARLTSDLGDPTVGATAVHQPGTGAGSKRKPAVEQPSSSRSRSARGHQAKKKRRRTGSDSPPLAKQRKAIAKRKRIPETIAARTAPFTGPGAGSVQSDTATRQVGDQGVGPEEEAAKSSDEEANRQQLEPAGNQAPLDGAGTSAKDGDSGSDGRGSEGTAKMATVGKDAMAGGSGAKAVGEEVIATGKPDAKPAAADKTIAESASANKVVPSASPAADATQTLSELAMKGADGGAALDLIVHDGTSSWERCATSVAMSSGASWCSVGQLARDWVGEVTSQPSSASGDQANVDPAEVERLREQLAKAQEIAAEVSALKEKLKNSVPVAQLASKLSARDAEHKQGTKDLREGLRRLHEEVNEMRAAEE